MKKLILIVFILFAISLQAKILQNFNFGTSFSARSSQIGEYFDYEIAIEFEKPDLIYIEIEKERENDNCYYNHEFKLSHSRSFLTSNAKWLNIQSRDIDLKQIDVRGVYSKYSLGIAQQWNNDIPETKIVSGIEYKTRLYILNFLFGQDFLTGNFKEWDTETNCKIDFDIYFINVYWKSIIKNYGILDWKTKFGIGIKL
jgi:hypothetical protein